MTKEDFKMHCPLCDRNAVRQTYDPNFYICGYCGMTFPKEQYWEEIDNPQEYDLHGYDCDGGGDYDAACDDDGNYMECEYCGAYVKFNMKTSQYECPICLKNYDRHTYFLMNGCETFKECDKCDKNYPYCLEFMEDDDCPFGHKREVNF